MSYTHYIDSVQVYPSGDWEIKHEWPTGCIFSRRVFSGGITFGNIALNKVSNDYDYIMSIEDCQRLPYEIKCNGVTYWEGYINHTIGYYVDEDNCTLTTTPLNSDEYDCFVTYGEKEFNDFSGVAKTSIFLYETPAVTCPYTIIGTIDYNMSLRTLIEEFISDYAAMYCTGFTGDVVSSFFWADDYPDGTPPTAGRSYVTGDSRNDIEIFINSIRNVRSELGSSVGTGNPEGLTFNIFMGMLKDCYNVYWYLDANGDFRLEHLYFFEHDFPQRANTLLPDDISLTTIIDKFRNKPIGYGTNKWEYLNDFPSQEIFTMVEADGADFIGLPILYDIECTYNWPSINKREIEQNQLMTDLQMIVDDPDSVDADGWFMTECRYMDIHEDDNIITGWTNGTAPNSWSPFLTLNSDIRSAVHGAGMPDDYCRSNDIGVSAIGTAWTLCYYVPVGSFVGAPQVGLYTAAGVLISTTNPVLASGAITRITLTANAVSANTYVRIIGTSAGGDALGNGTGDPATFNLDKVEYKYYVRRVTGAISGGDILNGSMSIANLMDDYWRYGRVLIDGTMNGNAETFESVMPNKHQEKISVPKCCDTLHWNTYFNTDLGDGKIYALTEKKDTYEVELLYP